MTTLEELKAFCNEANPVGALMLTGEWGCGKTYLIENQLKEELKDSHIMLRISLFGITSVEAINASVKDAWIEAKLLQHNVSDNMLDKLDKAKKIAAEVIPNDRVKGFLSFDYKSLTRISPQIDKKTVILIFDDLERAKVDIIDILGCINDYCENQRFHTIVIANEEQIHDISNETASEKDSDTDDRNDLKPLSYQIIKEKIVQRTIKIRPDYKSIVHAVVNAENSSNDTAYAEFLKDNEDGLLNLFNPEDDTENRPHNIRSLKCAIQDFHRVYEVLVQNEIENINNWLYAFVALVLSHKAGITGNDNYLFSHTNVKKLYSSYDDKYMLESIKNWVNIGEWDEALIEKELEDLKESKRARTPVEQLRYNRIIDLEDSVVKEAFDDLMKLAYTGELKFDEYVQIIWNDRWASEYEIRSWGSVDWNKLEEGLQRHYEQIKTGETEDAIQRSVISSEHRKDFSDAAWSVWKVIDGFCSGRSLAHEKNKIEYCRQLDENGISGMHLCQNKLFNAFDSEMADATYNCFEKAQNYDKCYLPAEFEALWENADCHEGFKIDKSIENFEYLQGKIGVLFEKYKSSGQDIARCHTKLFSDKLEKIISKYKSNTTKTVSPVNIHA